MRSLAMAACATFWLAYATGCDELTCSPPEEPEYDSAPVALGSPNTCGVLQFQGTTYSTENGYPEGCRVRLPMCVSAYPSNVQTCDCVMLGTELQWACPI